VVSRQFRFCSSLCRRGRGPTTPAHADHDGLQQRPILESDLAKLNRQLPYSVSVNGICTEFVQVIGFHNLTLKGLPGKVCRDETTRDTRTTTAPVYAHSEDYTRAGHEPGPTQPRPL